MPVEVHAEIQRAIGEKSVAYPFLKKFPMAANEKRIPVKSAAATCTWVTTQAGDRSEASPTFSLKILETETLAAYVALTEELLEDDIAGLGQYLFDELTLDIAQEIDNQALTGDGSTDPFTGVLSLSGINEVVMGSGHPGFDDLTTDDIVDLIDDVVYAKYMRDSRFYMSPAVLHVIRKLKNANGDPIFRDLEGGGPGRLIGYPVVLSDEMPTTSAASTSFIIFGNLQFYALGERVKPQFSFFDKTSYRVTNGQVFFSIRARYAFMGLIDSAFAKLTTSA